MDEVRKAAEQVRFPFNRYEILNRLSSLPEPKAKMKKALKDRMRHLAAAYVSLATFVDDEDIEFSFKYKKSRKTRAIYLKVIKNIKKAQKEMWQFKPLEHIQ